jgi:hypothetical protein
MYVNLFPHKQLVQTKKYMLMACVFLISGGTYALVREMFIIDSFRIGWALCSAFILGAGALLYTIANNQLETKEAYFSMNPDRVKYRLALFSKEKIILWKDVTALEISAQTIIYRLNSGKSVKMRLGNIQQAEVMLHVSRSIHLAALEKGITINGMEPKKQASVA